MKLEDLPDGHPVYLGDGERGLFRGPNPKIPGDFWIEFPGTGLWSHDPRGITPVACSTCKSRRVVGGADRCARYRVGKHRMYCLTAVGMDRACGPDRQSWEPIDPGAPA